jgi:hypothetical protein
VSSDLLSTYDAQRIPEPATLALAALGLSSFMLRRKRS